MKFLSDHDPNLEGAINFLNDGKDRDSISIFILIYAQQRVSYQLLELQITTLQGNVKGKSDRPSSFLLCAENAAFMALFRILLRLKAAKYSF
jgi:hypothetical protein